MQSKPILLPIWGYSNFHSQKKGSKDWKYPCSKRIKLSQTYTFIQTISVPPISFRMKYSCTKQQREGIWKDKYRTSFLKVIPSLKRWWWSEQLPSTWRASIGPILWRRASVLWIMGEVNVSHSISERVHQLRFKLHLYLPWSSFVGGGSTFFQLRDY